MNPRFVHLISITLCACVIVFACKPKKDLVEGGPMVKRDIKLLVNELKQNHHSYDWFSSKLKINYDDDNRSFAFSSKIRIRKDSVIWMQGTKLGLELARVLIRPDSVFIINRLERSYVAESLPFLSYEYGIPGDFTALQDLILGNPLFFKDENLEATIDSTQYKLNSLTADRLAVFWLHGSNFLLEKSYMEQMTEKNNMLIEYDDYQKIENNQFFSYVRNLKIKDHNQEVTIVATFLDTEFNIKKRIYFEIPPHYTRMRL